MDDLPVHKCTDCFGLWIPMPVIISLAKAENFTSLVHVIEASDSPITALPLGKLACPIDNSMMHFSVIHNVELDICPTCRSVWLDRGEFDAAAFRERIGWSERKEPEDNFLQLFIDTVAYTPEWAANLADQVRGRRLGLLHALSKFLFPFMHKD
jgi:Zn-finger nucleic acid-binding protein